MNCVRSFRVDKAEDEGNIDGADRKAICSCHIRRLDSARHTGWPNCLMTLRLAMIVKSNLGQPLFDLLQCLFMLHR